MWEPRGHADMYGAIIVDPDTAGADFGVIFIHNEGYSTGCGHAVLALTKAFIETGLIKKIEPITQVSMDVPSGFIRSFAEVENNEIANIGFQNVPSFVQEMDLIVDVPNFGNIWYDLAFGGAYYAFVDISQFNLDCTQEYYDKLIKIGMIIKNLILKSAIMDHPTIPEMNFLYGVIFTGPPKDLKTIAEMFVFLQRERWTEALQELALVPVLQYTMRGVKLVLVNPSLLKVSLVPLSQ